MLIKKLFRKSEAYYTVSDLSKAIGPIIDLMVVSLFIGPNAVTVLGYIAPLIMLFELIGTAISSGSRNEVSSLIGAGEVDEANRAFSGAVIMGGGLAVIIAILIYIFGSGVAFVLGARDPEISLMTRQYIYGYLIGFPFFTLTRILTPYLQMEGEYIRVSATSMLTTVIDVLGDLFIVFVLHGGMFGIGLATSLGYVIPFFVYATFFFGRKKRSIFKLTLKGVTPKLCINLFILGAPAGVVKASNSVGGILINNMLTSFKMAYLVAAYGIFSQIAVFVRSSWYAPADTLHAFAGIFIGEEDKYSLKKIQKISLIDGLIYTSIVTVMLFAFAPLLAGVFLKSNDPKALELGVECLRVACFSLPFNGIVYGFNNYLMAVKRIRFCNLYSFLIECGAPVPITFLSLRILDYHGAWIAKVLTMSTLCLIAAIYIYMNKEGDTFSDKMLLLPRSFGILPEDEIAVTATSTEEIMDMSMVAIAFAMEHGADRSRARKFGLIVEELSCFMTEHGFDDGKSHNINMRLVSKDEDLIIRMRDDCKPFNLEEYFELIRADRKTEEDISLVIIFKMAKDVKYISTFGANNLILKYSNSPHQKV